ncbi:MAG: DUF2784 domain-containing protein, partial [Cyclobacteriaceae bacterium]
NDKDGQNFNFPSIHFYLERHKRKNTKMEGNPLILNILDYFFLVFHTCLILFNVLGWLWPKTRKFHLIIIGLTFVSWLLLGVVYGWGYCFLTDWHWRVLAAKGKTGLPNSYISYLLDTYFGLVPPANLVDLVTVLVAVLALLLSLKLNFWNKNGK